MTLRPCLQLSRAPSPLAKTEKSSAASHEERRRVALFAQRHQDRQTKTSVVRGLLLDVTHHRRLETELRQAQKLESVGRLATGVVHEINTPIQFVTDSVSFVRDAQKR